MYKIISLEDVWKIYQMGEVEVQALKGVSLDINKGDFVAIVGSSGSGKSTMMNMIGCLDVPTKGDVYLKSKNISDMTESELSELRGKTIGFVFQQYNLIPNMTALENVLLPLQIQEVNDSTADRAAKRALKQVGLEDRMNNKPSQLSGGQQQRVSIARALACEPEIILADEPTGALDSATGEEIIKLFMALWESGKTIIMITHDPNLAKYAKTIVELKDGKIISITDNKQNTVHE
ncbi:ABC transporter related protein [Methanococcus maripaludis C5]|uniref:ABC transporter related protein n=1 Tax=Methanococcus maripaludis (strain C5 / ATCC BAA-1333) TaxID=402880 RepID=A4FYV2_METM5|nr:ABC transporter ATP-binding protein [Methanococcus maripaludis]ABO35386.1 ABC transporter related protein [Methanococcus maripaludis C5]